MKKIKYLLLNLLLTCSLILAQKIELEKIEPPNWWANMEHNKIQLMLYGKNLTDIKATFNTPFISIKKIHNLENKNYCFIDIEISDKINPQKYFLTLENIFGKINHSFEILAREFLPENHKGFNSADIIYLITPDRFANGDTANDTIKGFINDFNPDGLISRHGGDIKGITEHLNYLQDLGVTALWINPIVENNTNISYHGYSSTDFYKVDKRLGSNKEYKFLVTEAHKRKIKIIYDHVSNHISTDHKWAKNPPMKTWLNGTFRNHLNVSHNKLVHSDIYSSPDQIEAVTKGWFTDYMADLNQENPFLANWIIQNTIWWIEFADIDGIREDTYPYNNQEFMKRWANELLKEYPNINILAEVWTGEVSALSSFQNNFLLKEKNKPFAFSITDFALRDAFAEYLAGKKNIYSIYNILAKDFLYSCPNQLVTFADNHDVVRIALLAKGNIEKVKMVLSMLFTMRGIPQIFYGSELGIVGGEDHGEVRADFPGGFNEKRNAFIFEGRTKQENELYNFTKKLISIRKKYKSFSKGETIHYAPANNVYLYLRKHKEENILIIVNSNKKAVEIDLRDYAIFKNISKKVKNLISNKVIISYKIKLKSEEVGIFLMKEKL